MREVTPRDGASVLRSNVEARVVDLMDLGPEDVDGPFDVVLFSGRLYHLPEPLACLERVFELTAPGGG